ncbi:EAL domain-containing protein [Chitinibacter bivalviorum]|uniref:EAL domain-containing protein n=1 Tax=Chitinibacter bivalviorum TaxID=2739434 RepID=A0A7H9BH65_9NEIS|nr:bifunctional diguanylate cyclase/phosphodiesterase [Chitinibacter bivalviorum]QLG87548.1 EAL domain-containing protein [Chitinibacter bivalviorum]
MSSQRFKFGLQYIRSARAKVLLVLILLNCGICIFLSASIYRGLTHSLYAEIDGRLQTAASAIPYILPDHYIDQALGKHPIVLGDYIENMNRLNEYAKQTGIRYLYVLALKQNRVVYLADSASETEIAADNYGHFYQHYEDEQQTTLNALRLHQSRFGELSDSYGKFRSLSMILSARNGDPYLLGADISMTTVNQQEWLVLAQTLGFAAVIMLLGSLISWLLASKLTEPLRRFSSAVHRFTLGEFDLRMNVQSKDELGNLATAFNAMGDALNARESLLRQLAFVDRITGLPNRTRFAELINQEITNHRAPFAVVMMNLADFHYVNDCFGFAEGDNVLRAVADRLAELQPYPVLAIGRMSGNDFLLMISADQQQEYASSILRIEEALSKAIVIDDHKVNLAMRFGVSCYPEHATDPESLLRQAEISIFSAKEECKLCVTYDPTREVDRQSQFTLMGDLREAIENNQLVVQYQPKIFIAEMKVNAVEALVRWQHPRRGWIPPSVFIAFAEQSGKLRSITEWVVKDVLRQQSQWQAIGIDVCVSVNVGVGDVEDIQFVDFIAEQIQAHKGNPNICLEITETGVMKQPDLMVKNLTRLRELNIALSIDDFGTGYSSFAYLAKMPINELKIDQTFVMAMNSTFESVSIVRSMIELGHILGLKVVAEGVETQACWQALAIMGCDEIQGYLISKPLNAKDFVKWLESDFQHLELPIMTNMSNKL